MSINFRISILELYIFKLILASYEKKKCCVILFFELMKDSILKSHNCKFCKYL